MIDAEEVIEAKWEDFSDREITYLHELLGREFDKARRYPDEHPEWGDSGSPLWREACLAAKVRGLRWAR